MEARKIKKMEDEIEELEENVEVDKEILKNPYKYICDYAENVLPHVGKKCFEFISLMPPSLIIPDLSYKGNKIRSNINCLFLAPSGAGKTTITKLFDYFTYSPLSVESITSARLESEIKKYDEVSLIVGDLARMSRDVDVMKVVEGLLGEEKRTSRMTMRSESMEEKEMIGLLCGVPNDISTYFTSGQLFRTCSIAIFHSQEEHSEIGKYINNNIGIEDEDNLQKKEAIKEYYRQLYGIQKQNHPNLNPIIGYIIPENFKESIFKKWDIKVKRVQEETNLNFFRELHEAYRFLISHAFLNIFQRKIENGRLIIEENDLKVALDLMAKNINIKKKIIKCDIFAKSLKDLASLKRAIESDKIDNETRSILKTGYLKNRKV